MRFSAVLSFMRPRLQKLPHRSSGRNTDEEIQLFVALSLPIILLAALASVCAAQNPLVALENAAKEKAAEAAIETLLNNQLPLTLNAKDVYPTVNQPPGGPFSPTPLQLTADQLDQPLAPGDYTINTLDFCSEYSVHEPGAGVAYVLGPYEGKAAGAIGALIWRGTVQYHINPNSLQAVSWTIQSGLTYSQMPKPYQAIVDQVIPDFKSEIASDFIVNLETTYNGAAKTAQPSAPRHNARKNGSAGPTRSRCRNASAPSSRAKTRAISSASRRSSRARKAASTRP